MGAKVAVILVMKAPVREAIGEAVLNFPSKISAALAANDRIKALFVSIAECGSARSEPGGK